MLASSVSALPPQAPDLPLRATERRRHKRCKVTLLGRYMREDKREFPCTLLDISVGGIAVSSKGGAAVGERIIAYFDEIGGVEGTVSRTFNGGFAFTLSVSPRKREKLAAQLTWLVNSHEFTGAAARRHARLEASHTTNLVLEDGSVHPVRCLDVSVSGASIATTSRPSVGTSIMLGRLHGKVVRHHADGIAVQFVALQSTDSLKRHFG